MGDCPGLLDTGAQTFTVANVLDKLPKGRESGVAALLETAAHAKRAGEKQQSLEDEPAWWRQSRDASGSDPEYEAGEPRGEHPYRA